MGVTGGGFGYPGSPRFIVMHLLAEVNATCGGKVPIADGNPPDAFAFPPLGRRSRT
jgi:hypothetical protein